MKISNYSVRTLRNTITLVFLFIQFSVSAQETDINTVYQSAMEAYDSGNYKSASDKFKIITNEYDLESISSTKLYNGACIFSLNQDTKLALRFLNYLANNRFYSNYKHITSDTDLNNIHSEPKWKSITEKVAENKNTEPERLRKK